MSKPKAYSYIENAVLHSELTGDYFFVKKAKVIGDGDLEVIGQKINVTPYVKSYVEKAHEHRAELLSMLKVVLESAVPNAKEHPTMTKAWALAEATIRRIEGES